MKRKITILILCIGYISFAFGQNKFLQVNEVDKSIQEDYKQFLENQTTPFLAANDEALRLGNTAWQRNYGEKEYFLAPAMQDITEYRNRIKELDNKANGILKSKFHFLNVEITPLSKSLLKGMNINVPNYVQNNVNVYLPEIDIDFLIENNISLTFLESYGKNEGEVIEDNKGTKATIWSEGWEGSLAPYTMDSDCSEDCYWGDVSCRDHTGSYSLWVADDGTTCNFTACDEYDNGMCAYVYKNSTTDLSCYNNIYFRYWIWFDIGGNDVLSRYWWDGTSWNIATTYDGSHSWNLTGWNQASHVIGSWSTYSWRFYFDSNSISSSEEGIYLDDMEFTGDETSPPGDTYGSWSTCSNCSQSRPVTSYTWANNSNCYTTSTSTQTQACNTPPPTTAWSSCSNNVQSRNVYTCTGNGTWSTNTEYQCCGTLPNTSYGSWSSCNDCSRSRSVTTYSWGTAPNCAVPNTTQQTETCSTPPNPTSWSTCSNNQQHRTVYTCTGNGTYSSSTEYQCCGTLPNTDYGSWTSWINCHRSRPVTTYSWGTYPNCVIPNTTTEHEYGTNPTLTIINQTNDTGGCSGTATVSASGGTSYTYSWSNGQTTATATNLCVYTTYYVTVTDNNDCSSNTSVYIVGIEEIDFINSLSIYPNPTSGEFTIEMEITKPKAMELKLFNITGQILLTENLELKTGTYTKTIDISKYATGVYTLQLISDEGIINRKIVVE